MIRIGLPTASWMKRSAVASGSTATTRSSVDLTTREMSDVTMMVAMNHAAIFNPSGRATMLTTVV